MSSFRIVILALIIAAAAAILFYLLSARFMSGKKPVRSMTGITACIIFSVIFIWGAGAVCMTASAAENYYVRLLEKSRDFPAEAERLSGLEGDVPENPEYCMLSGIRNVRGKRLTDTSVFNGLFGGNGADIIEMDSTVVFLDADGNVIHGTEDYIYFSYVTEEDWKANAEDDVSNFRFGWIDLAKEKTSGSEDYAAFYKEYSDVGSLFRNYCFRIRGIASGSEVKPLALDVLTDSAYFDAVSALTPDSDEQGDSVSVKISELDAKGLLNWERRFDHTEEGNQLVTIYAMHPEMYVCEGDEVVYLDIKYRNLSELAAAEGAMRVNLEWTGEKPRSFNIDQQENDINRIIYITVRAYGEYTDGKPGFYMVSAIASYPVKAAVHRLTAYYIISAAVALIMAALLWKILKKRLVKPLEQINSNMAEHRPLYYPEKKAGVWKEVESLRENYEAAESSRRSDKNEIARLGAALNYAERAEENRRQMTSAIAHELKTPLAVVHSYAEGLKENIALGKREQYIGTILSETERMDAMVMELLDLSRLEAGKVKLSSDGFSLSALAKEIFERLLPLAKNNGLDTETEFEEECRVIADEARIGQVIENLTANAFNYCQKGGVVAARCFTIGNKVCFAISNTAERPFTREELSEVWETFYKTGDSRTGRGTGLGLAIVKNIIRLHGGECFVRNLEGRVEFEIRLPL